jgi:hypothetical protein
MPFLKDDETPPGDTDTLSPLLPSPGRDSSRLMQDLTEHTFADPRIHTQPTFFDPTKPHTSPEPTHTHSWSMKTRQSIETRPWNAHYEDQSINAVCETCRIHMTLTATLTGEGTIKCGSFGSENKSHHFHLESWTSNTRYSASSIAVETKPEYGTFQCCQCPFALQIGFLIPVVPEYLLSSLKRRKTGTNSALSLINRGKESKSFIANAFGIMSKYCTDVLNSPDVCRDINIGPESVFVKRLGLDPDVIKFMECLGWYRKENLPTMFAPPQWDESLHKGRLKRKLLEAVEIELAQLYLESASDVEKNDLRRMFFTFEFI